MPISLTRSERAVLEAIYFYHARHNGHVFPFKETLATRAGMSPGNLRKVLLRLKSCGYLAVFRRGRHAAEYVLSNQWLTERNAHSGRTQGALMAHSGDPLIGSKKTITATASQPARKPPQIELPSETITNEFGRVEINPAWVRVRNAVRAARERSGRARDPEAYLAAVIRRTIEQAG